MDKTDNFVVLPGQNIQLSYQASGVYSNSDIKAAMKTGHIVIHPFVEDHLKGSSYDVTIGEWFYSTEKSEVKGIYNPFDEDDVNRYFGKVRHAIPHKDFCQKYGIKLFKNIPPNHPVIILRPGERILAHTHEFIGIKPPGTTELRARSSWGRNGVSSCFDAGWGDPGYINRWTMEVYNLNQYESVVIPIGERLAQIIFHHTGPVENDYGEEGKYQSGTDIKALIKNWKPESMIPRAHRDQRKKPLPI